METIWLPALLIVLALLLIVFGPSQIGRLVVASRDGARRLLRRVRAREHGAAKPSDRSPERSRMRRL